MLLLQGILAAVFVASALATNSPGCGKPAGLADGTHRLTVAGKQREYILKLPAGYDSNRPYRLIFAFHALGGNAQQTASGSGGYYGLPPLANNSAIFVSPNGQVEGSAFNTMGWGNVGGQDIQFVDAMLEEIEGALCVNQDLRFSTGFSYGGAISYAIACARASEFRAIGILSGGSMSGCQGGGPSGPIATYQQHGINDQVLNINSMGRGIRDKIVAANGCTPVTPEPMPNGNKATRVDYQGCKEGYPVRWVVFTGDHTPAYRDSGQSSPMAAPNFWEFLSQFE